MTIQDTLKGIAERVRETANVRTVYGDPVTAEGKTIIPVARVRYGFGGGGGSGSQGNDSDEGNASQGTGGGGGGGIEVTPAGFIEITAGETRYVSFDERRRVVRAVVIGLVVALFLLRGRLKKK